MTIRTEIERKRKINIENAFLAATVRLNLRKTELFQMYKLCFQTSRWPYFYPELLDTFMSRIFLSYVNNPRRHFHLWTAWSNSSSSPCGHRSPNSEISIPFQYSSTQPYCLDEYWLIVKYSQANYSFCTLRLVRICKRSCQLALTLLPMYGYTII